MNCIKVRPGHDVKLPRPGLPGPAALRPAFPPGGRPGLQPAVAIVAHRLSFAAPRRLRAGRVAHTLPPRIPPFRLSPLVSTVKGLGFTCARRRGHWIFKETLGPLLCDALHKEFATSTLIKDTLTPELLHLVLEEAVWLDTCLMESAWHRVNRICFWSI